MYWITRLDNLIVVLFLIAFTTLAVLFIYFVHVSCEEKPFAEFKRAAKRAAVIIFSCLSLAVFIPDTKQALAIYGIGGILDYVRSNDKASQLPEKCINYLVKLIEEEQKE